MNLAVKATGSGRRKPVADFKHIGYSNARLDLPDKIFGKAAFIHDMRLAGMVHARVVRQPNRGALIDKIDEKAITRAAKGKVDFVRIGNFLAVVGDDETAVELAGAAAVNAVSWQNVEAPTAAAARSQLATAAPLHRPHLRRAERASRKAANVSRRPTAAAIWRTLRSRRPAVSRNIATVILRCGRIARVCIPLRASLAKALGLEASAITVHHVQGSGCYGHNGADDAAADAAIIAMQMPGKPVRVRWRREEEFVYEPKTSGHGREGAARNSTTPASRSTGRRKSGARRIATGPAPAACFWARSALPNSMPEPPPNDVPEIERRRRHPQRRAALRHRGQAYRSTI